MKVTFWGTRGSIAMTDHEATAYGGNTPCISVIQDDMTLILDAGTGIRNLGVQLSERVKDLHILLTHLHMDHIQGLGFFDPFFRPETKVTLWGPGGSTSLSTRLNRYLSPPLFPLRLKDFECDLTIRHVPLKNFSIGPFTIKADYICHRGPTLGYRVSGGGSTLAYLPDHEPVLGSVNFPNNPEWSSGFDLAVDSDLLVHDSQYNDEEYKERIGWGHCSFSDALKYAQLVNASRLSLFHHDPSHSDQQLEEYYRKYIQGKAEIPVELSRESQNVNL